MKTPSYFSAVRELVGGTFRGDSEGPVSEFVFESGQTPPTEEAVQAKLVELQAEYDSKKYQRDREASYPEIKEQLDLLYHDMTTGKGDKTGEWYKAVNKVKTDNPKPE